MNHQRKLPRGLSALFASSSLYPALGLLAALGGLLPASTALAGDVWVKVDTARRSLLVMQGDKPVRAFENISIGRNGITSDKLADDYTTPLGTYRVRRIKQNSRFHLYFGLDYPSEKQALRASRAGRISGAQYRAILRAHRRGEEPPPDTPLGGNIGIHGLGDGDPGIHRNLNWTEGCVALTDAQIEELARWIDLGTVVVIN